MNLIKNFHNIYLNKFFIRNSCLKCLRHCSTSVGPVVGVINEEEIINDRLFCDLSPKHFECLAKNGHKLTDIQTVLDNYEYLKYTTLEVPTTLTEKHMIYLLDLKTTKERNKYFKFLFKNEIKTLIKKRENHMKKSAKQQELMAKWSDKDVQKTGIFDNNGNIVYGLWHNSLFTRISEKYVRQLYSQRSRVSALFGQNIVFDLSVKPSMKLIECNTKLRQLIKSYQTNRYFKEPFDLNFCNLDKSSLFWKTIEQNSELQTKYSDFVSEFKEQSYLDLFDRKRLVYLLPNASKPLLSVDPNHVYVISLLDGFDVKNNQSILSRKEDIDIRRLPLDEYVLWSGYTKDLKSFIVLNILNDVRDGFGWCEAIVRNVKKDFIKSKDIVEREESLLLEKVMKKKKLAIDLKQLFE